jgi:hypothetical protein
MTNYHNKEYIRGDGPYWLFFRDDIIRLCREAGVDTHVDAYQIVFYLNDWFQSMEEEIQNGEASDNAIKHIPLVVNGLMKIFQHDYTDKTESYRLKGKLESIKDSIEEINEVLKDD